MGARPSHAFLHEIPNIRLGEFDLGGVLYHANYFHLYEAAREAFLASAGVPYYSLVSNSQHLAIVETSQKFLAPVLYGARLELWLWLTDLKRASVTFNYELLAIESKATIHRATTTNVFVELRQGAFKVQPFSAELKQLFQRFSQTG